MHEVKGSTRERSMRGKTGTRLERQEILYKRTNPESEEREPIERQESSQECGILHIYVAVTG
jgi:hypothetical protein